MKKGIAILIICFFIGCLTSSAFAHFGMIIPSDSMVMQGEKREITLDISFSHPFERIGMDMDRPVNFSVVTQGRSTDLLGLLKETKVMDHKAWTMTYRIERPGVYFFYVEPKPYWESAEDCYIVHYTKTITAAFGYEAGWDEPLGLKTEIVPLTRPFGLYAGNVFQGVILLDGEPVPHALVEIEYYNKDGKALALNDYMVAQTVKADRNGVFTYAAPQAGWWGFAALNPSNRKIKHEGEDKNVELGAVLWVEFKKWQVKK